MCRYSERFNKQFYLAYPNSFIKSLRLNTNQSCLFSFSRTVLATFCSCYLLAVRLSVLLCHLQSEARLYVPPARRTQGGRADHVPALRQVRLPGAQHLLQAPETVQEQGVM